MVCASSRAHIRLLNRNFRVCKGIQPSISIPQRNWRVCWNAVHSIKRNLERFSHRVEELRLKAGNRSQLKLLDSLSAANTLAEPQNITENMLSAFFGYLIQRGNIPGHYEISPVTRSGQPRPRQLNKRTSDSLPGSGSLLSSDVTVFTRSFVQSERRLRTSRSGQRLMDSHRLRESTRQSSR